MPKQRKKKAAPSAAEECRVLKDQVVALRREAKAAKALGAALETLKGELAAMKAELQASSRQELAVFKNAVAVNYETLYDAVLETSGIARTGQILAQSALGMLAMKLDMSLGDMTRAREAFLKVAAHVGHYACLETRQLHEVKLGGLADPSWVRLPNWKADCSVCKGAGFGEVGVCPSCAGAPDLAGQAPEVHPEAKAAAGGTPEPVA